MMNRQVLQIVAALLCAASAVWAGTTYYAAPDGGVDSDCLSPSTAGTLSNALSRTVSAKRWDAGDTVIVAPGDYRFDHTFSLTKNYLTVRSTSADPGDVQFIGGGTNNRFRAFSLTGPCLFQGFTITNFSLGDTGFAVTCTPQVEGVAVFTNCVIRNCIGYNAGNQYRYGACSKGIYRNCAFLYNTNNMTFGSAGALNGATAERCTFVGHYAYAGGAMGGGSATDCFFTNNVGHLREGGACNGVGTLTRCDFIDNRTLRLNGGGVSGGKAFDCRFLYNKSAGGGGGT